MAVHFQFVSAFICQTVLQEKNDVSSAIRILDVIHVPKGQQENPFGFHALISLKTVPVTDDEFRVGLTLVTPSGERKPVVVGADQPPHKLRQFRNDPSIPSGVTLSIEFHVKPKIMGTWMIEVEVDEQVVTRVPFTFLLEVERTE